MITTAYLPPVRWFAKLLEGEVWMEACENYVKQTLRNRCWIDSPNGPLALTIPVEKTDSRHIRDIRISDHGNWRHQHWNAFESTYRNAPYYEYLADDFRPFYEQRWTYLFDYNEALIHRCCELIGIHPQLRHTEQFCGPSATDGKQERPPERVADDGSGTDEVTYYQVFALRHGFLPNLSIIDLIFNMGPESILVLKQYQSTSGS